MPEDRQAPLVGQFQGPPGNTPRGPAELPRKTVVEDKPVAEGDDVAKKEKKEETARQKTPQEKAADYLKGLEALGISPVEARSILEKVLVNGYYEEVHKMGPISVTIRTRTYRDSTRTLRYLELEKPTYAMGINDVLARYNMAASLVKYGDTVFEHPSKKDKVSDEAIEDAFHVRFNFIMELPTVALQKLMQITHDFDEKISAVFAEGSPEDF